jgi:hypothetical protein
MVCHVLFSHLPPSIDIKWQINTKPMSNFRKEDNVIRPSRRSTTIHKNYSNSVKLTAYNRKTFNRCKGSY